MGTIELCSRALVLAVALLAVTPARAAGDLTAEQRTGRQLFVQRCSVCHLPSPADFYAPGLPTYGPKLEGMVHDPASTQRARLAIRDGTARMPAFRYTLDPDQIEQLLAYLEVFELEEFVRPGAEVGGGPDVVVPFGGSADEPMQPVLD